MCHIEGQLLKSSVLKNLLQKHQIAGVEDRGTTKIRVDTYGFIRRGEVVSLNIFVECLTENIEDTQES